MKAVFILITLRCLIWARVCALSQEELQSGLVTGVLQTKKSHNQAQAENTNHFRKRPLLQ